MLEVQKFLIANHRQSEPGYNFQLLTEQLGIKCNYHSVYPLVILNYCQIDSPKMNPIVMECRGIVLDTSNYSIVAHCMTRFFNYSEATEITEKFVWTGDINSRTKEDGSLISIFFNKLSEQWECKTRNSWADSVMHVNGPIWSDLVFMLLPDCFSDLASKEDTYVFELCSMHNRVVRHYPEPKLVLLTILNNNAKNRDGHEYHYSVVDKFAKWNRLERPKRINSNSVEEVKAYIHYLEETDGTAEGLVLQDENGLRIKAKSSTYLSYSRLGSNGSIATDKNLIPLILANEQAEAIAIFPMIENRVNELSNIIEGHFEHFVFVWKMCKDLEDQKEFALTITKKYTTPFNSILFNLKKRGLIKDDSIAYIAREFRSHIELIIKVIRAT